MGANKVEGVPFVLPWDKLGNYKTADSAVGLVRPANIEPYVIKWNRCAIEPSDAVRAATFIRKSIDLYKEVLGEEFIVPTSLVIGSKKDGTKIKPKVYIFQPFVDGWTGKDFPEELRTSESIKNQWKTLYGRLNILYSTARKVNRSYPPDSDSIFPVNITVGSSRSMSLFRQNAEALPYTPNVLISPDLKLKLCDFGPYSLWSPNMEEAYQSIRSTAKDQLLEIAA